MTDWTDLLSDADRAAIARGKWSSRVGFGKLPALIIIDAQNYMTGIEGADDNAARFPLACPTGFAAVRQIARLQSAARDLGIPVFQTRFVINPDTDDSGMFHRKVAVGQTGHDGLYFDGTFGAEICASLAPRKGEIVIDKKKKSAFFGTPLLAYLLDLRIDTCIVVGGSTSNCVRATVSDCEQHNFHTIVPEEAVFDRVEISHRVNLFDMNRISADVMPVDDVLAEMARVAA